MTDLNNSVTNNAPARNQISGATRHPLRKSQVCEFLSIGSTTLWDWMKTRNFPKPFYLSKNMPYWYLEDIEQWLDSHRKASQTPQEQA